jgi:hypothetical protein
MPYFNGADVCKHEKDNLVDTTHTAHVKVIKDGEKYAIETRCFLFPG